MGHRQRELADHWGDAELKGFVCPIWMTYRQSQELGGQVKKGEHVDPSGTHHKGVCCILHHHGVFSFYYMAEKRKPTYDLEAIKAAFDHVDKLRVTRGAAALGFGRAEIVAALQTMQRAHFYKPVTALWKSPRVAGRLPRSLIRRVALREIYRRRRDAIFADVV